MRANISLASLLAAASLLASCGGGGEDNGLTPVVSTEAPPQFISYPDPNMFIQGETITPLVPTITGGAPTNYMVMPDLPAGLRIDAQGRIVGTPAEARGPGTYIVTAGNSAGTTTFGVRITVMGRFKVGGYVTGLMGPGLVLTNNGADALNIETNGAFVFTTGLPAGGFFDVAVAAQPQGQICGVAQGSGWLANIDYRNVVVNCSAAVSKSRLEAGTFTDLAQWLDIAGTDAGTYIACNYPPSFDPERDLVRHEVTGELLLIAELTDGMVCGSVLPAPDGAWVYWPDP